MIDVHYSDLNSLYNKVLVSSDLVKLKLFSNTKASACVHTKLQSVSETK